MIKMQQHWTLICIL